MNNFKLNPFLADKDGMISLKSFYLGKIIINDEIISFFKDNGITLRKDRKLCCISNGEYKFCYDISVDKYSFNRAKEIIKLIIDTYGRVGNEK